MGGYYGTAEVRSDIVAIRQFYPTEPWLPDENGRANGVFVRVYFVAPRSQHGEFKGVFVRGSIKAAIDALNPRSGGGYERERLHEWTFTPRQAAGLRLSRPSIMGDSYGLVLRWPAELDVQGREIQFVISYQRGDGEVVARRGSRFRVPLPDGQSYREPIQGERRPRRAESQPAEAAPPRESGQQ